MHNLTAIKKKKFLRRLGHILESANDDEILTNTYNLYVKKVLLFFLYGYFVLCYLKYILYPIYIFVCCCCCFFGLCFLSFMWAIIQHFKRYGISTKYKPLAIALL